MNAMSIETSRQVEIYTSQSEDYVDTCAIQMSRTWIVGRGGAAL